MSVSLNINQKLLGYKIRGKFKKECQKKIRRKIYSLRDWDGTPFVVIAFSDKLESVLGWREALEGCQCKEILLYLSFLTLNVFKSVSVLSFFQLWDLAAGKIMFEFTGHTGPVNVVEFHPNEYLLASGSSDRYIKGRRKKGILCVGSLSQCLSF